MQVQKNQLPMFVLILAVLWTSACHRGRTPAPLSTEIAPAPQPAPAPTVTLTAEPSNVPSGDSTTLTWSSQNATELELVPEVGKVQTAGSASLTLHDSTTFTLTATGPGGIATATARVTVTARAIPAPVEGPGEEAFNTPIKDAYFDFEKANIRPDAAQALSTDGNFLKQHPAIRFTIEGHCDDRGSEEYNLALGDRRAKAARDFLVNGGVSADRISTISYGKTRPLCTDQTEECWQKNRRAHFHYGEESQ